MNSALYLGRINHSRKAIKPYHFSSQLPWWLIDLAEIEQLTSRFKGLTRNRFSLFNFRDYDHIDYGQQTTRDNILAWAKGSGVDEDISQIMLLTNLRTLGYVFNPVSFYFLQGKTKRWVIAEIGNTFWEQKPTLMGPFYGDHLTQSIPKLFYISPFLPLDNHLAMKISWPGKDLVIRIEDTSPQGHVDLTASFIGQRLEISQTLIYRVALRFPFLCLRIITAIHWHALKLWLMGIPFIKKMSHPHLQQGVYSWKSRKFVKKS